jgi:CxxC-x17-CxxC domain-containing protein
MGVWSTHRANPSAPRQGLHNGTWIARRRPLRRSRTVPTAVVAAPEGARDQGTRARGEEGFVTYVDRTLTCVDCGVEFIHSAADQEYYVQKGFASDPKRCASCRASRRASREAGYDVREIGGPRGYERSDDQVAREYFAVICSSCGNQAQVPFKPRMDRPVYCSDCFRQVKPD